MDDNIQHLRHARVPFGIISSPFLLAATIQHHIQQNLCTFTDKFLADFYTDNLTTGTHDLTDAVNMYRCAKDLFAQI